MKLTTKSTRTINLIVIGMLTITAIVSVGFYFSRPQSAATANGSGQQVSVVQDQPVDIPAPQVTIKEPVIQKVLSQTIGDVAIEVTSAKIIKTGVEVSVCYTTLDGGEWYLMPGHLLYSTYEIYPDEFQFTTEEKADGVNFGKRCAQVRYRINDLATITTPIQFSVIQLRAVPREMYSPCQEFQQRLETSPTAQTYGLKATCEEKDEGSISVALADHNQSVTADKADTTLNDIAKGVVSGPWAFTITTLEK